ncbi:MAG: tRNA lysidine(34) synthetase TilS, partial [Chloroflexi bacterium]|nr:tRNA lysidine(34) synthetase TilS [Chloroflexota bacterium]
IIQDRLEVQWVKESLTVKPPDTAYLDYATVGEHLLVRGRRRGDRLRPLGRGDVSLSRFLIQRRVPFWRRDGIPIVAGTNGVVWVGGLEIDSRYRVTDRTDNILELRLVNTCGDVKS